MQDGNAVVGLTSGRLVCYNAAGRRVFSTPTPAPVVAMAPADVPNPQHVLLYVAALADGAWWMPAVHASPRPQAR